MHVPLPVGAPTVPGSDKGIHFVLYFILALLGGRCVLAGRARASTAVLMVWLVIYGCYAGVDEWLQQFVGRTPSVADWVADVAGVAVATVLLRLTKH